MKLACHFILFILFILFMCGCKGEQQEDKSRGGRDIKILTTFRLSPQVDSLLLEFKKEFQAPAYAIFMDKKSEGLSSYRITIAPFNKKIDDFYESCAVSYFILNDSIPVFLYTGLEDFVICDSPSFTKVKDIPIGLRNGEFRYREAVNSLVDFSKSWSYIYEDTTTSYNKEHIVVPYVVRGDNYPFSQTIVKPTVQFDTPTTKRP